MWLQYSIWFGRNGLSDYLHIRRDLLICTQNNHKAKLRNQILSDKITALINDLDEIEARARYELGMLKFDEKFYQLIIDQ